MGARARVWPDVVHDFGALSKMWVGPFPMTVSLTLCIDRADDEYYLRFRSAGANGVQLHFVGEPGFDRLRTAVSDAVRRVPTPAEGRSRPRGGARRMFRPNVVHDYGQISTLRMAGTTITLSMQLCAAKDRHYLRLRSSAGRKFPPAKNLTYCFVEDDHFVDFANAIETVRQDLPTAFPSAAG